jgi:gliding motility-associated lipoprotein GldH
MMRTVLISLSLVALLSSCREPAVYREYIKMPNVNWERFNILEFDVPVKNGDLLDFYLFVRHHTNFPYDKLYVNITFYSPDGEMRSRDYDFKLKDEEGEWLSEGMGELWDIELPIRKGMPFYAGGKCKIRVENKYSKYDTPGIIEVGLIVKESKEQPDL